jgi:nucleoside-diphosphate-sugar epimerase
MLSVFLSGGSGFIGRNLQELLGNNFNISAPSHRELDLTDSAMVKEYFKNRKFDVAIHAAASGSLRTERNAPDVYETSMAILKNLVENSGGFGRMILFGSGAEYGKQRPIVKVKESNFGQVQPLDEYGLAKYQASEYIAHQQNIVSLRCFGVFGPYEDYTTRFIANIICQSLAGYPITVRQNVIFDYIYIKDLARIISFFIQHKPREKFYNVGRGQGVELLSLAQTVKSLTSNPHEINILQPGMGNEYTCDNSLLMQELGGFEFTPMEQAIQEMVDWYEANWDRWIKVN